MQLSELFQPRVWFQKEYGQYPNIVTITKVDLEKILKLDFPKLKLLKSINCLMGDGEDFQFTVVGLNAKSDQRIGYLDKNSYLELLEIKPGVWVIIGKNTFGDQNIDLELLYTDESRENIQDIIDKLAACKLPRKIVSLTPKIYILCSGNNSLYLQERNLDKDFTCDVSLNYGESFKGKFDNLINLLETEKKGLFLFSSKPGFGKTSLIKHIIKLLPSQKVVFLPPAMAGEFANPSFLPFILKENIDLIICEDAEIALLSRDEVRNQAVSSILNITDGIMGDLLKIKILCTFNTDPEKIDPALLRKGRLKWFNNFESLKVEECDRLLESLGHKKQGKVMTLAEIYNFGEDNGFEKKEQRSMNLFGN